MDEYDKKFRSMQKYLPYLEEKIEHIKKIKLKFSYPDPDRDNKLKRLQLMYSILTNNGKKVTVPTLERFESVIKKMMEQDEIDRQTNRREGSSKKDINPYHNPDIMRPGSSSSNVSGSSITNSNAHKSSRKVFDDTPASPSPPRSPSSHGSGSAPIIIPTERRSRYVPVTDSPPRASTSGRGRNYFGRSPTPPPSIPNVVPISKVDINEMQPGEWDTDEEDDRPEPVNKRPEIVIPKPPDVAAAAKKLGETFPFKKEEFKPVPKRDMEKPPHIPHPSENIPTVQVNSLGGSRRLASVIEKTNLLNERSINRLLTSHRPISPPPGLNDDVIRSPSDHHMRQPPASVPFSPTRRDSTSSGPGMPSLLLNAPSTRAPVALEDIVGLMDDKERSNIRRHDTANKQPSAASSRPMPVPSSRLPMPNSSPVGMSPRSDGSTMSPLHTDHRLSGDPRSRSTNDPRSHSVDPRSHSIDPRSHNIDPRSHNSDPRSHTTMPSSDPRSHGNAVPRYADNYERHKRTIPVPEPPIPSNDYSRQRQMEQFGPDNPGMMTQPLHPVPNPVPGPVAGPGPGPGQNPMYNPHNQMGPMNYDYRMGPVPDSYGNVNVGPAMQSPQQQWNGPPHPHMQSGPPQQAPHPFPMGPGMRGPEPQGWQNTGPMYPEMQQHPQMMNGDARMSGGYPGPMPPNMGRGNTSHIQPLMTTNTRYPTYQDTARPSYDEFQRSRPWSGPNNRDQERSFGGRPNTPFNRQPANNSWGGNKDGTRPNRDPRVASGDRDPRNQHRPEHSSRPVTPTPKETPPTKTVKGPPPGKEVHPNKLAKQAAAEKEAASKKRPELHKSDSNKSKEKERDKDKDKDKHKNKDKDKDKSKTKSGESMKSPLTDLYGAIDAKKAVQGTGLQKFKIPKKRPSADTRPEPPPVTENNCEDDEVVTSSSPGHETATKHQPESTTSKKSSKSSEKIKETAKDMDDSSESDLDSLTVLLDPQKRKKSKKLSEFSKTDLSVLLKSLMKKLKKKKGSGKSLSGDDDDYDCSDDNDDDDDVSDELRSTSSSMKKKLAPKKRRKAIIESSSDDSESESAPLSSLSSKKEKKRPDSKKSTTSPKNKDLEKAEKEKKKDKKTSKQKSKKITDDSESGKEKEDTLPEPSSIAEKESVPAETPTICTTTTTTTTTTTDATPDVPVKPKPKRRFRELDMLQEDLKSSWICDGAMKATGSRTCSLKNKPQEPEHATDDEPSTSTTKGAAGKMKKPAAPKSKAASKVKKAISESSLLASSDSDEDMPLARRSEGLGSDASLSSSTTASTSKSKKDTSPKATGKKSRAKNVPKVPPPLFDSSSNDSFNLDPSAVEPTTDISLHPETSGKGKNLKKGGKKAAADAESSSDESFVSNTSSLLPDNSAKPRDNNAELLDDVMAELARKTGKKKQTKKKKSNWQNGIVSKKKRKKAANRLDESTSHESAVETSMANDADTAKEADASENVDRLNDDDDVGSRLTSANAIANVQDDEDLSARVDAEALIGYTFNGNEKYQCLLCPFYRKNIVHHYKTVHPGKEVLISRLSVEGANLAKEESERLDFENNVSLPIITNTGKYSCRFCTFTSKGIESCARESFYEHCTIHTGEYRFSCLTCNYEAIAKGSIRTHYYKDCRKLTPMKNFNEAMIECPIPDEDRIYGYLCEKCNFVQLKRSNVEQHVKRWHSKEADTVKIIKIDMSLNFNSEVDLKVKPEDLVDESIVPHHIELKDEKVAIAESETMDVDVKAAVNDKFAEEMENEAENEAEISVMMEATEHKPTKAEKTEKSSNLSAFVCPDELVDKDVEIQNERKKKMQEIAQNIGIKVDKDEGQKRLSITDQLRNKIETSLPDDEPELAIPEKVEAPDGDANESIGPVEDVEDPLHIPEEEIDSKPIEATVTSAPAQVLLPEKLKDDPDVSNVSEKEDKASVKMKDPLEFVNEPTKKDSDDEASYEETNVGQVQYDSDSSASQSDHEMATDVKSILQNSGEMHSPSKGQMMTTIQRLAAQLQQKPLDTPDLPEGEPESINADPPDVQVKTEKSSPKRPGDDMAILSPTRIKKEVKREPMSPPLQVKNNDAKTAEDNTQKPVIRIRRISGDKLSKGGEPELTSMATIERIQRNANDDDSGFLKIANVVSLAENESDSKMVTKLRKVVETSPQKSKGLSVLKKPNSFILKRVDNNGSVLTSSGETVKLIPISLAGNSRAVTKTENFISIGGQQAMAIKLDKGVAVPITMTTSGTAPTTLVSSTNQPIKFLKIAAPEQVSVAIKLKSANVYEKMLKDDKLVHMFKCMGRDCSFTASNELAFHKHLRIHEDDSIKKGNNEQPKDYFKCAYCYIDCKSYDELMFHLKKTHIFCRYCCKYCFYRAFAYSYVEIHQRIFHQMKKVHILIVSEELVQMPPPPKRLERKQIIKPYVCVHDCNKYFFIPEAFVLHLNMHHANIQSNFKCHLCQTTVPTVDNLIEHYKQHGYFKYHCMYCTHGSASMKELHSHLSSAHYNQPPHILERCLPREISKNLSAIDQLRVRDVDAIYRQRKGTFEEEHNGKVPIPALNRNPIQKPASPITIVQQHPPLMSAKVMTTKENNNTGGTFVPLTNLDGGVSNIRILDARSLSTTTTTSLLNLGKNIKVTVTEPTNTTNNDKLSINKVNVDDNNEFVSTNLLDHTELLSGKKANQSANANAVKADDYDSDIEIIEDYTDTTSNKEALPIKKDEIKEEVSDNNSKAQDSEESTPIAEGSESATTDVKSSSKPNNEGRFLKIEDVKGTGVEGKELYRCGVETCDYAAETPEDLRLHMMQCSPNIDDGVTEPTPLYCVHCGPSSKRFSKASFFIDHLKTHGLKRFSCAVCNARFAVQGQAQSHVRAKHKFVNSKIVPADPMNPSTDGLFIVHPIKTSEKLKNKKQNKSPDKNDPAKLAELEKTTYSPDEIEKLPLSAIFMRAVQCALCPYSNKVRTNVVRHLQAHLKDESVPDSSPVNPVPCLDKKERMFDKMVNLASSSHENGRMGGGGASNNSQKEAVKSEEDEGVPKYVPENKRFVCGVPECNYLTVDEAMLRHHLKALHSDELYFRCPHCPAPSPGQEIAQNIALEKMGIHLKMHDSRLYKCSHCIYHHYHRHVVERHMSDKHPEKRQFVKVIRELQTDQSADEPQPEQQQQEEQQSTTASQESEESEAPDPDGNTWKCNLCDFKCVYKTVMQQHATNTHDEKCQFKCKACGFKTASKVTFDQHLLSKHPAEPNVEFITIYQRIKGLKKAESLEPATPQDEPFDTTPLWRRDMPRIRHIRGILLEEEDENETIRGKRKADDGSGKPAKLKSGKSDDLKTPDIKKARNSNDDTIKSADGNYGSYGRPNGCQYVCTICNNFKSKYKQDFRDHLFRDLKYFRWPCTSAGCEYKGVNRTSLFKHYCNRHSSEGLDPVATSPNAQIEEWVALVIKTQTDIMKGSVPPPTEEDAEESDYEELTIDVKEDEENDISDNDDEKVSSEVLPTPLTCKHCHETFGKWRGFKRHVQLKHLKRLGFLCPYCDRSTNSETVILQHVRSKHKEMPEKVLENPNPQLGELSAEFWEREYGLVVPKRQKKRKRRDDNLDDGARVDYEHPCDKCDFVAMNNAGLKSHMKTHEVRVKQKCDYCTFSSFNSSEMRQHWEVNHPHLEFKVEEAIVMSASTDSGNSNVRATKKAKFDEEKKATVYYCYYCDMGSTSLDAIRSHWKMMHMDDSKSAIFKYKEHSEPRVKCAYCAEPGTKSILVNHIWQKHGNDKPVLLVERDEDGWMCKWCKEEFFTTKEEMESHHNMFHSHLRMNYKIVRRIFSCKQCSFETLSLDMMQKHAKNHLNVYKCKHCTDVFKTFAAVKAHFKYSHPNKEPESCTITNDDLNKEIEAILSEAAGFSDVQLSPVKVSTSPVKTPPTSPRIAKKSTTKQSVVIPMRPFPNKIKAVARKSTNPLPRYPAGIVFETENLPNYVSYYGKPIVPVDLGSLNTTLAIGGLKMKVDCAKLAEMLNIEPILRIKDFMKERGRDRR